jgi:glycosyltransferase domain-containing protein
MTFLATSFISTENLSKLERLPERLGRHSRTVPIMTDRLTIVVPTYNRPEKLKRLLSFLHDLGCPYPVVVLDGSRDELKPAVNQIAAAYPFVSLRAYSSEFHLGLRCADGLNGVASEYVVFCADDDFVFPGALTACMSYLDDHQDYAAAIGEVRALVYGTNGRFVARAFALPEALRNVRALDQDRFILRSLAYWTLTFVGSLPLFYSVRRTAEVKHSFSMITTEMKYSAMELLTNASLLISGKVAVLQDAFGLRDYTSEPTRDAIRDNAMSYYENEDIKDIREKLIPLLMQRETMSRADAEYCVDALTKFCTTPTVVPSWSNPMRDWCERKYLQVQRLLSLLSPSLFSRLVGFDKDIVVCLSAALGRGQEPK